MLVGLLGCQPKLIKATYDYGILHTIYTSDGIKCSEIPKLYQIVKNYLNITKANMVFVRIFGAVGEVTYDNIIPTTRFIKIGIAKNYVLQEEVKVLPVILGLEIPEYLTKKEHGVSKLSRML